METENPGPAERLATIENVNSDSETAARGGGWRYEPKVGMPWERSASHSGTARTARRSLPDFATSLAYRINRLMA
jgi:hypothetical protein